MEAERDYDAREEQALDSWKHPHAGFQKGIFLCFRALSKERDPAELVLLLAAYVSGIDTEGTFDEQWEDLQQDATNEAMAEGGMGEGMTWPALRALEFQLIIRHAKRLKIFDPLSSDFTGADLERRRANIQGRM